MPPVWTIIEYAGRDGLMRLEPDWIRLIAAMPDAGYQHLFETHAAYLEWLPSALGPPTFLALSDGTRIRAICPVELQEVPVFRVFTSPVWGLPKGLSDVAGDVICPPDPEAEAALLSRVAEHLRRTRPRRRWFVLARVLEGTAAWRCLRGVDTRRYCIDRDDAAHVINCDRPFADLTSQLSRKFRANLRSAHKRLQELPDVRFERTADADGLDAALDRFLRVEASGWKGESGSRSAVALKARHLAFYRAWVASLGAAGRCEFNELRLGETAIASTFCIQVRDECTMLKIGYDEQFAHVRPGHLVLERIFQQCCEDPSTKRVNMVSSRDWHLVWEPDTLGSYSIYLGIGGWTARVRLGLLRMGLQYWPGIKRWLQRSHAGSWITRRVTR